MKKLFVILVMLVAMNASGQWVQMSNGMPNNNSFWAFAANGNNIFAGSDGVYLSTNNGITWTGTTYFYRNVYSLAVSGNNIIAGVNADLGIGGIYISSNNGTNWAVTNMHHGFVLTLAVNGNYVFAGEGSGWGFWRSLENGTYWAQIGLVNKPIVDLAVDGNNIFAATWSGGVYISTNNGTNWSQTTLNNLQINSLAVSGNNVFAGTQYNGVYISTNYGSTWAHSNLPNIKVASLVISGNSVFAGTDQGIYISTNNGINWFQRNEGFSFVPIINELLITNNYIFAGTDYHSVWRRSLSEIIGIENISTETPSKYSLSQNYPNPFNPTTNIKFSIVNTGDVKLVVYDIQGREVQTLVNESLKPGTYEAAFDASALTTGVYFYKLVTNGFTETKKMLMIK